VFILHIYIDKYNFISIHQIVVYLVLYFLIENAIKMQYNK